MRILMAVPKYPFPIAGGLEGQAHQLAKTLVQRGHCVHALSSRFDPAQQDCEAVEGVRVHRVRWIEFAPARFLLFPFSLAALLFKLRAEVDLVHVHNLSWFGAFVTLCAKALGLPVLTKLPNFGDFGIARMQRGAFGWLRVFLLQRSDAVVAMTAESLAELAGIGYPMGKVLKAVNGIARSSTAPAAQKTTAPAPLTVVFVGRLAPEKGLSDLLHAWASARHAAPEATLRLIGAGPQGDELRVLAADLELGESVQFAGFSQDVAGELAKAEIFVLPSYAEGNSNAILEAMRAGLPIVATHVGGAAFQVGSAGADFLVAPGDRAALAARLVALIEDQALRRRVGQAMRARIEHAFTMDRVAAVYERAFELIVRGRAEQLCRINPELFSLS